MALYKFRIIIIIIIIKQTTILTSNSMAGSQSSMNDKCKIR